MTMNLIGIIMLVIFCAIATAFLYKKWSVENSINDDTFKRTHCNERCVTKGDMYCNHHDWCDAEIALYPEQYEAEMKRAENDKD